MKKLDQSVFDGYPFYVNFACVDYDGLLKLVSNAYQPRYTWASERWRGIEVYDEKENSGYEPLTFIWRN